MKVRDLAFPARAHTSLLSLRLSAQFLFSARTHISLSLSPRLLSFCSARAHTSLSLSASAQFLFSVRTHISLSPRLLSFCSARAHISLSLSPHLLSFCSARAHTHLSLSLSASSQFLFSTRTRDARYTGTVKLPVFIIFQTVRYHNFAQFCISYAVVPRFTCRWQCFSNCCASSKCDNRTSELVDGLLISFSIRIWHLPTLPKAPKVG